MSAPFDPSKLDLDINSDSSAQKVSPSPLTGENSGKGTSPIIDSKDDILSSVTVPETSEKIATGDDILKKELSSNSQKTTTKTSETISPEEHQTSPILPQQEVGSSKVEIPQPPQKIIDINIASFQDILYILLDEKYDFVTLEPEESEVKITFKKDGIEKDIRYIKFPNYTNILLKTKQIGKIESESTTQATEAKGSVQIKDITYDILIKLVPSGFGEKIFLKAKQNTEKKATKKTKKTNIATIFGFLGAVLFVSLILGGAFITFIILNAQTVEDVNFFRSLGINLNDINTFISRIVTFIFSLVLFIETVVLAIFLFKFIWTKKEFKKKRVLYGMISTILLMITFSSASAWMIIDGKIKSLPNWQELAYGDIQIYDNSMLISEAFDKGGALLSDTKNLIGPITIKYDVSLFESNERKKGFDVQKYIWTIGKENIEALNPTLTKEFSEQGNYEIRLIVEEVDLKGEIIQKEVENIPSLSISHVVDIEEQITTNGGKIVQFDATKLQNLGKIEWYFGDDLEKPVWEGFQFKPTQIFFEETIIVLSIVGEKDERTNKVFVIGEQKSADIEGDITFERSTLNDLEYTLKVTNPETNFGDGFIEEFEWIIGDKTVTKKADPTDLEKSSEITFEFKNYGDNEVSVILKDSSGQTKELSKIINIPRNMKLKKGLTLWNNEEELENVRYMDKTNEYFLNDLGIPTTLKLDARFVAPENFIYSLREVTWDFENDNNIDGSGKTIEYDVMTEGNHTVVVNYKFVHRKNDEDIINIREFIYIEGVKKEAVVDFKIEAESDYVPVTVRFDASKSTIKNDDIVKFEYDYGDGVVEIRDAINPGHIYTEAGDYTVKLTITGRSGRKYTGEKKLILKPEPQDVEIDVSIKSAPVGQGIDFSSEESDGQITEYFWDFGDGNTSTEANPTHSYTRPGNYKVTLRVDFSNNNSLVDSTEIDIYKE